RNARPLRPGVLVSRLNPRSSHASSISGGKVCPPARDRLRSPAHGGVMRPVTRSFRWLGVLLAAASSGCQVPPERRSDRTAPPPPASRESDDPVAKASKLWSSGRIDEAGAELKRAIESDPKNARARYLYASLLAELGELRAAAGELEQVVAMTPGDPL